LHLLGVAPNAVLLTEDFDGDAFDLAVRCIHEKLPLKGGEIMV